MTSQQFRCSYFVLHLKCLCLCWDLRSMSLLGTRFLHLPEDPLKQPLPRALGTLCFKATCLLCLH